MLELVAEARSGAQALPAPSESGVQVWREHDGTVCAYGYSRNGEHWMVVPGIASFCFSRGSRVVRALADAGIRPELVHEAYGRSVLPMALQALGTEVLHASAVRMPQGVVAFAGVSGAGKSTIAFGLGRRGFAPWADDALALQASRSQVHVISLPFRVRLRPASASFFRGAAPGVSMLPDTSGVGRLDAEPAALAALFVLRRIDAMSRVSLRRLTPAVAFPDVLTHAYCFSLADESRKRRMVAEYLVLAASVPVFEIAFGPELEQLPAILDAIERTVAPPGMEGR